MKYILNLGAQSHNFQISGFLPTNHHSKLGSSSSFIFTLPRQPSPSPNSWSYQYWIPNTIRAHPPPLSASIMTSILAFLLDTLARQIYLNLMLRLPQLYFSHVIRIFGDVEMSMPEIEKMVLGANNCLKALESGFASPRYENLKRSSNAFKFIDSLMREWKRMNIISVVSFL